MAHILPVRKQEDDIALKISFMWRRINIIDWRSGGYEFDSVQLSTEKFRKKNEYFDSGVLSHKKFYSFCVNLIDLQQNLLLKKSVVYNTPKG